MRTRHGNGNGHGRSLSVEIRLLPTPNTKDGMSPRSDEALARARVIGGCSNLKDIREEEWGKYTGAIERWATVSGEYPPAHVEGDPPAVSPGFVEWMMGLPRGWVSEVKGITREAMFRVLGNGVMPQQAERGIRLLLGRVEML